MTKAFLDTTILTDILLKPGESADKCKIALQRFTETELPVYAIKEFKAGPLRNFAWLHNKLVTLGSFHKALKALQSSSRTPRRYLTSTALEALTQAAGSLKRVPLGVLVDKYGRDADEDAVLTDQYRLAIKTAVFKAWRRRRKISSKVVNPLDCYPEATPYEHNGLIELDPTACPPIGECSLSPLLKSQPDELEKLRDTVKRLPDSHENTRRYQALRQLCRKPKEKMTETICRNLGDAVFALTAPDDAVILTTNIRDHRPLAVALRKRVEQP